MILPQTLTQALIVMLVGMLCWGLWTSMYKLAGKWRYELFYFDLSLGLMLTAALYAATLGTLGYDGFSFTDDLMHSRKHQWLIAFGAGAIFNLANMIMMGGVVVAGMSVAVPLGLGSGLLFGLGIKQVMAASGSPLLLFAGTACLTVSLIMIGVAYSFLVSARLDQMVKEGKVKTTGVAPGAGKAMIMSTNAPSAAKGLILSIVAGALMWIMFPLVNKARAVDFGMGPYTMTFLFCAGMFATTFVYNLFFINLPVEGEPVEIGAYVQGGLAPHLAGLGAGVVLCTGILAYFLAEGADPANRPSGLGQYAVQLGAVLVAAIAGIFKWKDFRDAEPRVRAMVWLFLILFTAGVAALSAAARAAAIAD